MANLVTGSKRIKTESRICKNCEAVELSNTRNRTFKFCTERCRRDFQNWIRREGLL